MYVIRILSNILCKTHNIVFYYLLGYNVKTHCFLCSYFRNLPDIHNAIYLLLHEMVSKDRSACFQPSLYHTQETCCGEFLPSGCTSKPHQHNAYNTLRECCITAISKEAFKNDIPITAMKQWNDKHHEMSKLMWWWIYIWYKLYIYIYIYVYMYIYI